MSDYLPQEVIVEIFIRLPIKFIIQCTSLSKSWYALITSPSFISAHLNSNQDEHLLVRSTSLEPEYENNGYVTKENYALYCDNDNFDHYVQFDFPFESTSVVFDVVGSCNGLLCLSGSYLWRYRNLNLYYLWNPSIRKSVKLPEPIFTFATHGRFYHTLGFGFDPVTNDYKVVRIVNTGDNCDRVPPHVELYKLSTGVWHGISRVAPACKFFKVKPGVYLNGACHWVAEASNTVVLFDVHDETFREMRLPDSLCYDRLGGDCFNLFVSEESLCLANHLLDDHKTIDIWSMREYGDPESWAKQFNVSSRITFNVDLMDHQVAHFLVMPIGPRRNGEILWRASNGLLVSYDSVVEKIKNLGVSNPNCSKLRHKLYVNNYKMSLLLLDKRKNEFSENTGEESSKMTKPKGGRKVLNGKTKRGWHIVFPFRFSGLWYMSKLKSKRLRRTKPKNRSQADTGDLL